MTEWSAETADKLELIDMYVQCTYTVYNYVCVFFIKSIF